MYNMNSGYNGYRMSNRAVQAYENGEMPLSKWSKKAIIEAVAERGVFHEEDLKKFSKEVLKDYFLRYSSWHHTSSYCKETAFYEIGNNAEEGNLNELIDFDEELKKEEELKRPKKRVLKLKKVKVQYLEWMGSRKHPIAVQVSNYALLIGNQAYLKSGKRKSTSANGFKIIETFDRCPRGTKSEFDMIKKNLPESVKNKIKKGEK